MLHEFPTDTVRLRIAGSREGQVIQSSERLANAIADMSVNVLRAGRTPFHSRILCAP